MTKISRLFISLSLSTFFKSFLKKKKNNKFYLDFIKKLFNYKYIYPTSMCRVGFLIFLEYIKEKYPKKNEILICSYNLKEMIDIPRILGFKIVLIDVDKNGFMNLKELKKKISIDTSAILLTNMFNEPKDSLSIKKIAKENKITLIEDNAIYFGNYYLNNNNKKYAGSIGDISIGSFGIMKNISALYGGYIATNDKNLSEYIKLRIDKFQEFPKTIYLKQILVFFIFKILTTKIIYNYFFFYFLKLGHRFNINFILKLAYPAEHFKKKDKIPRFYYSKISKISENILHETFKSNIYKLHSNQRKNKVKTYHQLLSKIDKIKLIKIKNSEFQNFLEFPILVKNKHLLSRYLFSKGIETKEYYYKNCEDLIFKRHNFKNKNSTMYEKNLMCLPCHPEITIKQINKICDNIKNYYN